MDYQEFLNTKRVEAKVGGFTVEKDRIHPMLFDFQKDIVIWTVRTGRAACFADCGLGKTFIQLEWARIISEDTGGDVLIIAPLAVSLQTKREGEKIGITVHICRKQVDVKPGINITNYEMAEHFQADKFSGVVLDESSCLKNYSGATKKLLTDMFAGMQYKLCCTATPSPNDHMEILNHASYLDVMQSHEALAIWFINDSMNMGTYRLKNHAVKDFWKWVSSWAVSLSKPSDLGYEDNGFNLPLT